MARVPTVKVEDGSGGYVIVNESDFDAKSMKLWKGDGGDGSGETEPPTDPAERLESIKDAIGQLDRADSDLWTGSGAPKVEPIQAALGFDISAGERDEAWAALTGE